MFYLFKVDSLFQSLMVLTFLKLSVVFNKDGFELSHNNDFIKFTITLNIIDRKQTILP